MTSTVRDKIDEDAIIRQVEKVCLSPELKAKRLLCDFLSYIVSEYLAGRSDQIKGYSIGVDVFDKGEDFDPDEDSLVRIHAGRLRRMLDLYYLKTGRNDPVLIEVPKGSYAPVISLRHHEQTDVTRMPHEEQAHSFFEPGVILFPFENLTGNTDLDYFARGFSEELSLELTKFEDLIIYDYTKSGIPDKNEFNHSGKWRQKGGRFAVEGSIMKASGEVKVLVKLFDIANETQVWAERYSRKMTADNLNDIQESIAREVAHLLGNEYGIIFQRLSRDANRIKPRNMDTYTAILRYYNFLAQQSPQTAHLAFSALEQVLRAEPDSPVAMSLLSAMLGNRYMLDQPDAEEAYVKMGELAETACRIDPNSSTVMAALVFKCFVYNERERFFDLANRYLSMVKNNSAKVGTVSFHLALYGGWERAKLQLERVMHTCHEFPKFLYGATALYYFRKQQFEKALIEAKKYNLPYLFWAPLLRISVYGHMDRKQDANDDITHLMKLKPDFEKKAGSLLGKFIKEESLVEHVMEGLFKAGLSM